MNRSDPQITPPPRTEPHIVETILSVWLRSGVILSVLLIAGGTTVTFVRHAPYLHRAGDLSRLTQPGAADFPHSIPDLIQSVRELRGQGIVTLGLLLLTLTPVVRVALSIGLFAYERDPTFVMLTTAVLIVLIASFLLGKVE